jgi:hypothetical protein
MDVKEAVLAGLKELILPELQVMQQAQAELRTTLGLTNKRLDDINSHLIDQSRRIDETNKRIDETNKRIDETNKRIDNVSADLIMRIDETNKRIDETNRGLSRLYEVIVRREEHQLLTQRVARLEQSVEDLTKKQQVARVGRKIA